MSMKLIILGLLMEGDKHPYEIQQIIKQRNMDRYIRFQKGSLYYAFERLNKEGLIEVSEIVRESSRPDRTVHRITEAGRQEFKNLLYQQFSKMEPYYDPIYSALAFVKHVDDEIIIDMLSKRIQTIEALLCDLRKIYDEHRINLSGAAAYIMEGGIEHTETELSWMRKVCNDAVAGKLKIKPDISE